MCGIIGYVGRRPARELLLGGLERLEYRGYDSAGISTLGSDGPIESVRAVGNLAQLRAAVEARVPAGAGRIDSEPGASAEADGGLGIGHTRWATHGAVTEANAHPHTDTTDRVHIVLNGIVENHGELRARLIDEGAAFTSQTDAEVVAHLVAERDEGDLAAAARAAYDELEGHYAFAVIHEDHPELLVAMRKECPLVIGLSDDGSFLASSVAAFLEHTNRVLELEDGETAVLTRSGASIFAVGGGRPVMRRSQTLDWDVEAAEKGGYDTFLAKEIDEQADAVAQTLAGRLEAGASVIDGAAITDEQLRAVRRVRIVACGTSYHSGLVGQHLIEDWARLPVEVDIASEYRYRNPIVGADELVLGITQSGETADTLAAMRLASAQGATVLAVTNVMGSQATREADGVVFTRAGIEVSVAATKTFTSQASALAAFALQLGRARGTLEPRRADALQAELSRLPQLVAEAVAMGDAQARALALRLRDEPLFLFLGRHAGTPVAMEGALKLKEITYRPAEAYAAGELKHGPIALIAPGTPVLAVATTSDVRSKLLSNLAEVRARGAFVVAITDDDGTSLEDLEADETLTVPRSNDPLVQALLAVVPLQLLAYHLATALDRNVDQPRNLAKTVTVE
jgi:glucosamine--fructose-6-phosphate aminotransferase (isomerizing)